MTDYKQIEAFIKAGDKATQGCFTHIPDGKKAPWYVRLIFKIHGVVSWSLEDNDSEFECRAYNTRQAIKDLYEENKRLKEQADKLCEALERVEREWVAQGQDDIEELYHVPKAINNYKG